MENIINIEQKCWSVWRQDDNGNKFCIKSSLTETEAVRIARKFESLGHKQMFWVSKR